MTFDLKKPVQTRDGRKARIICTDRDYIDGPIVALVTTPTPGHEGKELLVTCRSDGSYFRTTIESPLDLVNIVSKISTWQPVYHSGDYAVSLSTKESARLYAVGLGKRSLGFLRRDYEDGIFVGIEFIPEG